MAASVTLPLSGPVHADASSAAVDTVAPLAAVASVSSAVAAPAPATAEPAPTMLVSRPVVQELPASTAEADEDSYEFIGTGIASFYGVKFAGRRTASGAIFDPEGLTAAHPTLPFGTHLQVTNASTGESVVVTVTDRGPYHSNRVIDLSKAAAREIGLIARGSGKVELAVLSSDN